MQRREPYEELYVLSKDECLFSYKIVFKLRYMKKLLFGFFALLVLQLGVNIETNAQAAPKPRKSPMTVATLKSGKTYIKVVYSQPFKNEREIFGSLVPFGKVWRTGANEATEITVTQKIKIGGKTLPAGTYSLFSIPNADKWTIILNKDLGLWGEYEYNAKCDQLRFDVPVKAVDQAWEAFTIKLDKSGAGAVMTLVWDKSSVEIPIELSK